MANQNNEKTELIFAVYDDNSNSCDVTIKNSVQKHIVSIWSMPLRVEQKQVSWSATESTEQWTC